MADTRKVRPGESLLELAYSGGFDSWKTVWNHEANAELRQLRKDPQVLLPGDELAVPQRNVVPKEACPVDKVHRFRLVRPRAWVNLRMVDGDGEPLSNKRFELRLERQTHDGTTDDDGLLSVEIPPDAHEGVVTVWLDSAGRRFEAGVKVGHLDPASEPSGLRARLVNLSAERIFAARSGPIRPGAEPSPPTLDILSTEDFQEALGQPLHSYLESRHDKKDPS